VLSTATALLVPESARGDAVRLVLAVGIGVVGYLVGIAGGSSRPRAILYGLAVAVIALVVALIKNVLAGH
jgi:hypothetical protein